MRNQQYSRWAMVLRGVIGVAVLLTAVGLIVNQAASQDKPAPAGPEKKPFVADKPPADEKKPAAGAALSPEDEKASMAEMMALMEILGTPGEGHKRLETLVGSWDLVIRSWCGGPDKPCTESKGTSQVRWILGGRYLSEEVTSEFVMPNPETGKDEKYPFQGQGLTGYDNYRNMYVGTWVDSMSTQMFVSRGSADQTGKVITYYGEMDEPALDVHGRMVKMVTRLVDKDKHVMEMYDLHAGDNFKVMEIVYTRKN